MGVKVRIAIAAFVAVVILMPVAGSGAELRGANSDIDEHALFRVVGAMYDLDPELLEAVAEVESSGAPNAVSPKGAIGLMQLMPATAVRFRVHHARDPVENALGAARYLAYLRDAMLQGAGRGQLWRILAAYNAGEGAVSRYGGLPPYLETQEYVGRVLWVYLLGVSPPQAHADKHYARTAHLIQHAPHSGDRSVLEQLDSLRRARAAEITSDTTPHD
jgi:soluble lytic murein transglycosylase-like protein